MKLKPLLLLPLATVLLLFSIFAYALLSGRQASDVPSALTGAGFPDFRLTELQDGSLFLGRADLGAEPVLVNVWATWCGACRYEHPVLNALAAAGVKIIGLNYKDDRQAALQWLADYADPYALDIYDPNGDLGFDLGVTGAPETFFVDSGGHIQYRYQGPITQELWDTRLEAIFNELS